VQDVIVIGTLSREPIPLQQLCKISQVGDVHAFELAGAGRRDQDAVLVEAERCSINDVAMAAGESLYCGAPAPDPALRSSAFNVA
jgi:hypothetical protein